MRPTTVPLAAAAAPSAASASACICRKPKLPPGRQKWMSVKNTRCPNGAPVATYKQGESLYAVGDESVVPGPLLFGGRRWQDQRRGFPQESRKRSAQRADSDDSWWVLPIRFGEGAGDQESAERSSKLRSLQLWWRAGSCSLTQKFGIFFFLSLFSKNCSKKGSTPSLAQKRSLNFKFP